MGAMIESWQATGAQSPLGLGSGQRFQRLPGPFSFFVVQYRRLGSLASILIATLSPDIALGALIALGHNTRLLV